MPKKSPKPTKKVLLRLYPERDDDLIRWLQTLADLPYGAKSQALKAMLRRGLEASSADASTPSIALEVNDWIPEIRRALAAELDQRQLHTHTSVPQKDGLTTEDNEAEALLEQLSQQLLLGE